MDAAVITKVQAAGFDVYMRSPNDTYLYFTDGQRIGYLQNGSGGYDINTVNKPSQTAGTGARIAQGLDLPELTAGNLALAFAFKADWQRGEGIVKFKDMAAFLAANSWNAGFQKQETV
jgi:hypothetical protein